MGRRDHPDKRKENGRRKEREKAIADKNIQSLSLPNDLRDYANSLAGAIVHIMGSEEIFGKFGEKWRPLESDEIAQRGRGSYYH